jgi:hypothetical protein
MPPPAEHYSARSAANTLSVRACAGQNRQSQTASTEKIRAAARIDSWEGQRPRLTQVSSTARPHLHRKPHPSLWAVDFYARL